MIIDCVLTACNNNPMYLDFLPIMHSVYNSMHIEIKFVLIMDKIPINLLKYQKDIILFKPIENISDIFQSQVIRLLYPALLNYNNGILITDMDMMPLNKDYFVNKIKTFDNNKFINLAHSNNCGDNQLQMCYNIATPTIWGEIFGIKSIDDIRNGIVNIHRFMIKKGANHDIKKNSHRKYEYWCSDQHYLYHNILSWKNKNNDYIFISYANKNALLCRNNKNYILDFSLDLQNKIKNGYYIDYHMLRPYSQYKDINDKIVHLLVDKY